LGPYEERNGFRVIHVTRRGARDTYFLATKEEAQRTIQALTVEIDRPTTTIHEALKRYLAYMRDEKGNKPTSVEQTRLKMSRFFPDLFVPIGELDHATCAGYYEALRTSPRRGRKVAVPVSVDYHRNMLSEARTFLKWCVKQKMLTANPLDGVEGVGRRRHGKEQLRIDEARKWIAKAREYAERGEAGAVAAMMTLLLGTRCGEIVSRIVRDLDDDGRMLWIPDAKTFKGRRTLLVPDELRPYMQALAKGKGPNDLLFGKHHRDWPRHWVQRICREAGVPVVTAHGQRGLHATLAVEAGVTSRAVADALGHESFKTTAQSYARADGVGLARQTRALSVLQGGKNRRA
jgi:integrase